jgi:hypothetical protein
MNSPSYCRALGQLGPLWHGVGMDNAACGRRSGVMAAALLNGSVLAGGGTVQIGSHPRNYNWMDTEIWSPLASEAGGGANAPAGMAFTCDEHVSYACTLVNISSLKPGGGSGSRNYSSIRACAVACTPPPRHNASRPNASAAPRYACHQATGSCVPSIFGIEESHCKTLCPGQQPPPTPAPPKPSPPPPAPSPPPPPPPAPPPPPTPVDACLAVLRRLCGAARRSGGVFSCGLCTGEHHEELKAAHCNATEPQAFCNGNGTEMVTIVPVVARSSIGM